MAATMHAAVLRATRTVRGGRRSRHSHRRRRPRGRLLRGQLRRLLPASTALARKLFGFEAFRPGGRELGPDALDAYTEVKTIHLDLSGGRDAKPYDILLSHAD